MPSLKNEEKKSAFQANLRKLAVARERYIKKHNIATLVATVPQTCRRHEVEIYQLFTQ